MTTQHTPGKWQEKDGDIVVGGRYGGREFTVATVNMDEKHIDDPDLDTACANARLIAAAPELLTSLEAMIPAYVAALERLCELGQGFGACMSSNVLPDARDAVNQATGRELLVRV